MPVFMIYDLIIEKLVELFLIAAVRAAASLLFVPWLFCIYSDAFYSRVGSFESCELLVR
jgi:hypothetical protein